MSEPFRTRSYVAVEPSLRPRRTRRGVRVVVSDGTSVLLMRDTDPGVAGSAWWITPGGGIDPGEDERAAAVRELAEETGLRVEPEALVGPLATRSALHGYSDHIALQHETFFVLVTPRFEPELSGFTEDERITVEGLFWLALDELATETVWTDVTRLLDLAGRPEQWPLDLGVVEESVVPVDPR